MEKKEGIRHEVGPWKRPIFRMYITEGARLVANVQFFFSLVVVVSSNLVFAAHHLSSDVSFSPMWRCLWPQRHLSVSHACVSKAFRHQQTSEKMLKYFYTSFGNEMDETKQGRKK